MSETTIALVDHLAERFPRLRPILEEHVSDNFGAVLPHLFFGDLTRYAVDLFLRSRGGSREGMEAGKELRDLLDFLEDVYVRGGDAIEELISVSFLEHLPRPNEEVGWDIRSLVGPEMSKQLEMIG